MRFDETYDDMLHEEFSSRGKHEARAVAADADLVRSASRGRHAAADETPEGPRGFQRYRTAALVGAGGMACAAAGALLGGLGGYFSILPAAAHPVAVPTVTQDLPLAQAISAALHSSSSSPGGDGLGTSAVTAADFAKVFGSLTNGASPFASLTSMPFGNLSASGLPGLGGSASGSGGAGSNGGGGGANGGGGGLTGCTSGSSGLDLTCILSNLTGALGNLGSLTGGNPGTTIGGLVPSLNGVVTDVTGTLQNLTTLLPIASLPLPSGGLPTSLAGSAGHPVTGVPGTGGSSSNPVVGALGSVLNTVGAATSGAGSPGTKLPSLPLPTTTGTTVPSTTTTTTTTPTSGGSPTVNVPIPVPVPVTTPTITIGGLSVGVSGSGSTSGLTLTLP